MAGNNGTQRIVSGGQSAGNDKLRASRVDAGIYKCLFKVVIRHGYNDLTHGRCRAFSVFPSPTSAEMMAAQGMVFHDDGAGFSVYIRESQIDSFVRYLRRQGSDTNGDGMEYWTWISFVLVPQDPLFVGITSLPIDTNPLYVNLYGTNQQAHHDGVVTLLNPGAAMGAGERRMLTDAQFSVQVPGPFDQIVVRDISGKIVLTTPSDAEIERAKDEASDLEGQDPDTALGDLYYVQVDLSSLPLGLYTYRVLPRLGLETPPVTVLYSAAKPNPPLVFLDILFSQPDEHQPGIYPVPPLYDEQPIRSEDVGGLVYDLRFATRETWWQYYVVSRQPGSTLHDLAIAGDGIVFNRALEPVLLPSGQLATLFQSDDTVAMREIPPQRLTLTGMRRDAKGKLSPISVDPLPTAPVAPVWPAPKDKIVTERSDVYGTSEMFVYV
ncbi:MAG: hypothetical protein JSR60_19210 [Proteobacteria bacterium]|nr:hypothetical protein [Pseudomonadota bacterium]